MREWPACYPGHYALAHHYARDGEAPAAMASLAAARDARPDWWAPHWSLALGYLDARNYRAARAELGVVRKLAPELKQAGVLLRSLPAK